MAAGRRTLEWPEERDLHIPRSELSSSDAEAIHAAYSEWFDVDFPNPVNQQQYRLRSNGYVGTFPVRDDLLLRVTPKVPVASLFGMLEYAYDLKSFHLYQDTTPARSLDEVFETLALVLAQRILDRIRRGLHRDYIERTDDLPYVRGRLLFRDTLRKSLAGAPRLVCEFEHHTPELEDNHILAWTLHRMRDLPFEREEVRHALRKANQSLRMTVDLRRVRAEDCINRLYHRLNRDYQPMHALCRFFLEQSGPRLAGGERETIPFSVWMPSLFETFVARWLERYLPGSLRLKQQYHAWLDRTDNLYFRIDMVLSDAATGEILAVLDTKYKDSASPSKSDVQQIVAYATRMRTKRAVLIYPSAPGRGSIAVGDVLVELVGFDLGLDKTVAGANFLRGLMEACGVAIGRSAGFVPECSRCGGGGFLSVVTIHPEALNGAGRLLVYCDGCRQTMANSVGVCVSLSRFDQAQFVALYANGHTRSPPDVACALVWGEVIDQVVAAARTAMEEACLT